MLAKKLLSKLESLSSVWMTKDAGVVKMWKTPMMITGVQGSARPTKVEILWATLDQNQFLFTRKTATVRFRNKQSDKINKV